MREKLKKLYISFKEFPEVILFSVMIFNIFFQKSDVKFRKKTKGTINILGNGPSAHVTYLMSREGNEKIMCLNYFALTNEFQNYRPESYALLDSWFFLSGDEKNRSLMNVLNSVSWDMQLFIPAKYKNIMRKLISNKNINIKSLRVNHLPGDSRWVYGLYLKNLATPKFQNVVVACIYISLNRGFSKIKLHGVEASEFTNYTIDENNDVLLETQHSYGNEIRNMSKEGLIKKGEFWRHLSYYALMLKGFSQVSAYAKYMDSKIYNYTKGSYIDSFEKK